MDNQKILKELSRGNAVETVVTGRSMEPRIMEGSSLLIFPYHHDRDLKANDVVFVKINGKFLTHQILEVTADAEYIIGNMKRKIDGVVNKDAIYGICK